MFRRSDQAMQTQIGGRAHQMESNGARQLQTGATRLMLFPFALLCSTAGAVMVKQQAAAKNDWLVYPTTTNHAPDAVIDPQYFGVNVAGLQPSGEHAESHVDHPGQAPQVDQIRSVHAEPTADAYYMAAHESQQLALGAPVLVGPGAGGPHRAPSVQAHPVGEWTPQMVTGMPYPVVHRTEVNGGSSRQTLQPQPVAVKAFNLYQTIAPENVVETRLPQAAKAREPPKIVHHFAREPPKIVHHFARRPSAPLVHVEPQFASGIPQARRPSAPFVHVKAPNEVSHGNEADLQSVQQLFAKTASVPVEVKAPNEVSHGNELSEEQKNTLIKNVIGSYLVIAALGLAIYWALLDFGYCLTSGEPVDETLRVQDIDRWMRQNIDGRRRMRQNEAGRHVMQDYTSLTEPSTEPTEVDTDDTFAVV